MKKVTRNSLVVQSNELIRAKSNLNPAEAHLIAIAIAHIEEGTIGFARYEISAKLISSLCPSKHESIGNRLKELVSGLYKKPVIVNKPNGSWVAGPWFSTMEYDNERKSLIVEFSPTMIPFLLQLKNRFTKYTLKNILSLNSTHHVILYEVLKQYSKLRSFTLPIEDIRAVLGLDGNQHKRYTDMRRYVLEPAIDRINDKTDLFVSYEPIRDSRKISRLRFHLLTMENDIDFFRRFVAKNYPDQFLITTVDPQTREAYRLATTASQQLYDLDNKYFKPSASQNDKLWEILRENKHNINVLRDFK